MHIAYRVPENRRKERLEEMEKSGADDVGWAANVARQLVGIYLLDKATVCVE